MTLVFVIIGLLDLSEVFDVVLAVVVGVVVVVVVVVVLVVLVVVVVVVVVVVGGVTKMSTKFSGRGSKKKKAIPGTGFKLAGIQRFLFPIEKSNYFLIDTLVKLKKNCVVSRVDSDHYTACMRTRFFIHCNIPDSYSDYAHTAFASGKLKFFRVG